MASSTRYPEIDYNEIKELQEIGYGSFGTVYKAEWRSRLVAVKKFRMETEVQKEKIEKEIQHLCRVNEHPHVVDVYGVSKFNSKMFLIMEYAPCGSLQKFLHYPPKHYYSDGHALNWILQCAEAVKFLHKMKPKPLLHRDLKPANLLLLNEYRTLKICDFGTVAECKTYMTQAKGSVAWMAPEVLKGRAYTEKCDVYSLGVILWEVFARQQPFEGKFEIELAIGYYVINGGRPKLKGKWPTEVKKLIENCWDKELKRRPSMNSVVRSLKNISKNVDGGDVPLGTLHKETLQHEQSDDESNYSDTDSLEGEDTSDDRNEQRISHTRKTKRPLLQSVQRLIDYVKDGKIGLVIWATRILTIICTIGYILPFFGNFQNYYNIALLANSATNGLRLLQRLPTFQLSRDLLHRLVIEDSCHYLIYSISFLFVTPLLLVLLPVVLFAILHSSAYSLQLLDIIGQNSWWGARFLIGIIEFHTRNILRLAAFAEIIIMPLTIILVLMNKASVIIPLVYYYFLLSRYTSRRNPYNRNMFVELRMAIDALAIRLPPVIAKILKGGVTIISRLSPEQLSDSPK